MAKAPPKPEASEDGAAPKKKGKLMMIIVIVLLVVLIIVAGIGALLLLKKDKGHDEAATADGAVAAPAPPADRAPMTSAHSPAQRSEWPEPRDRIGRCPVIG